MLNATGRSKGLRKFIPQPDRFAERYGRFTLTARDVEILDVVHRYRYLEARHIRALVGGSDQQITRRLQGLFHNKYLGRYARRERMRLELDPGAPLIAYGLELNGARALERQRGAAGADIGVGAEPTRWKKEYTRRTDWFLEHHLMVSHFRCVLEIALRELPDTELVTWSQGKAAWFQVPIRGERNRSARVAPDAYFVLRRGEELRHFFLEADRSTEERRLLLDKFVRYWCYLQERRRTQGHAVFSRAAVLIVASGSTRMWNLLAVLRDMRKPGPGEFGGKGAFWFCEEREVDLQRPLSFLHLNWRSVSGVDDGRSLAR